jgi:Uma2 family endonuclease
VRLSFTNRAIRVEIEPVLDLKIPVGALDLDGFCEWAESSAYPERGRITFIDRELLIDMSPEEIETHIKVKDAVNCTLNPFCREHDLGEFLGDGAQIVNKKGRVSNEPDAVFIRYETSESDRARFIERRRRRGQVTRIEGTPDWVLEVVSRSSVSKDTKRLRRNYFRAGIPEYWLIDARGEEIDFKILVRGPRRYVAVPEQNGWFASPLFGRDFRFERSRNRVGRWKYTLHVRETERR